MCIDAPESTTNSRSSGLRVDAGKHLFSEGEKNVALSCSLNFNTFLASFHASSFSPCSCHSVSSWDWSSNFGALGLRWWGSTRQIYPSEGFWCRILAWRAMAFVNFTRWFPHVPVHFRRTDFGGVMSWNTQPNCRASDDRRWDDASPKFLSLLLSGFPGRSWHSSVTGPLSCQSPFFSKGTALLSSFFLDFFSAVHQLDGVRMSTFPQTRNHSWSCTTSTLEGATFHKTSCCKFLWGNPCKAIVTFYHWDFFLWDFGLTMIFAHSAAWKNSETDLIVNFFHAYWYRGGNCNCLLSHTARWFPIANNLQEFFVHAVLFPDSYPRRSSHNFHLWPQNSYFEYLARYFFSP